MKKGQNSCVIFALKNTRQDTSVKLLNNYVCWKWMKGMSCKIQ